MKHSKKTRTIRHVLKKNRAKKKPRAKKARAKKSLCPKKRQPVPKKTPQKFLRTISS
jgi:hypothetical protein